METIEVLCLCAFNILSLVIGVRIGQKVAKGEEVKTPDISKLNPIKAYQEHQNKKEYEKEQTKLDTILKNIERYDGTDAGQEDVPM